MDESDVRLGLACYPSAFTISTRFNDMDKFGHVNNSSLGQMIDDGLARFNSQVFGLEVIAELSPAQVLVAGSQVTYRSAAGWPADVVVGVGATRIGTTSFGLGFGLFQNGRCTATADLALVYALDGAPTALPRHARDALSDLMIGAASSRQPSEVSLSNLDAQEVKT